MERLGTIVNTTNDQTGSAQERERDAGVALAYVLHHPVVGAGLGQDALALNELRGPTWTEVHNVYLNYAVDLGLPGLGLFLLLLIGCVTSAARVRDRSAGLPALRELSALAEAIRITLVAFAVAAFFHPVAYQFYFYYFAGLAVGLGGVYAAEVGVRPGSGGPLRMRTEGDPPDPVLAAMVAE
jgi:O-antigen ligase